MEKTRNYGLDILRVLACYFVIQIHTGEFYYIGADGTVLPGDSPFWVGILNSLLRTSVPLFVMTSGFFLLPIKEDLNVFFRKRFTRVVIPFVVWCALYAIYWALLGKTTWAQAFQNIVHIPVNFGTEIGHLWYVYMLIGLYLFVPLISPWVATASRKSMELYLALFAFAMCVPFIHQVFPEILGECWWNRTPMLYYFSGLLGYMILAAYIRKYMLENKTWHFLLGIALILVGYAITAGVFIYRLDSKYIWDLELSWGFDTINVAMMTFGVFLLLKNVSFNNPSSAVVKILVDISQKSYGIYLLHIMVLNFFHDQLDTKIDFVVIKIPVIAICSFITSYVIIKLLSYLPKSKYIVG
nr:acyltransferase family protein [uncultured Flavobacterium sp.]